MQAALDRVGDVDLQMALLAGRTKKKTGSQQAAGAGGVSQATQVPPRLGAERGRMGEMALGYTPKPKSEGSQGPAPENPHARQDTAWSRGHHPRA